MITIIGLGNPGKEYEDTRHNAGRVVLDEVIKKWSWRNLVHSAKLGGKIGEGVVGNTPARVFYPDTHMNHSGRAAKKVVDNGTEELVVVYDEIDLPFGEFKLSYGRGAGGHNGLKSVIDELGTPDFLRVRVGIAPRNWLGRIVRPRGDKLADYVLGALTKRERAKLEEVSTMVAEALELFIKEGKEKAMNKFN